VKSAIAHKYLSPNLTLQPEWDLIELIKESYELLPNDPDIKWVKGHQDDKTERHLLTLPEQSHGTQRRPMGPFLPTTRAQLIVAGESVSSHYKSRLRDTATLPRYFTYLRGIFNWSEATSDDVDWSTYKQIIRRPRTTNPATLVKHLHKIAPTGHIAHRNNAHYSARCPACDCATETNDHVMLCPAATRQAWRQKSRAAIILYVNQTLSSDPHLCDILRDGLSRWENDLIQINPTDYPAGYHQLIQSQNLIGWSHLYRARWSRYLQLKHSEYANRAGLSSKKSDGPAWVRKVGLKLLQSWFNVWKIRNDERHGADEQERFFTPSWRNSTAINQ
jgi:hypothetical protein